MNTTLTADKVYVEGDRKTGYRIRNSQDDERLVIDGARVSTFTDLNEANRFAYDFNRRSQDPAPWIKPGTMERFAEQPADGISFHRPRLKWPEQGGRMVRRDYLRPGDRAVSSHYGVRTVQEIQLSGTEGQTTTIVWADAPQSESYDSSSTIELLG